MGKKKRSISEINSSSMADIAFLLLCFFLVTTSMSTTTGLPRVLPPPLDDKTEVPPPVNKRNLFVVRINSLNHLLIQGEELPLSVLRGRVKEFVKNENNNPHLPMLFHTNIPLLGEMTITRDHVISLQNDRDTQYRAYMEVQNELVAAYNELRDELSKQKFSKLFVELNEEQQDAIKKVYPMKISEAEPKNYGGNR